MQLNDRRESCWTMYDRKILCATDANSFFICVNGNTSVENMNYSKAVDISLITGRAPPAPSVPRVHVLAAVHST